MENEKKSVLTIIQPNKVTTARYYFTEREENILTLIIDALQKHMTREQTINFDLFKQPYITINTDDVGSNNKKQYLAAAQALMKKTFEFEYINEKNCTEEVRGVLITTVRNEKQSQLIHIHINPWAIPYLLYWGKGVGGTIYNKKIALSIPGEYTKRLYKLCKKWEDRGGFTMSIDEFRAMMCLEEKYHKIADLQKRVLNPSIVRMKEHADVYFEYDLQKVGGSRQYNMIRFKIIGNNRNRTVENKTDMYQLIYSMLSIPFPSIKSSKAMDIADKLSQDPDKFEAFYQRMKRLKEEFDVADKDITDLIKIIKHILKQDYGIE
jgi:plasmid replication initiation protein